MYAFHHDRVELLPALELTWGTYRGVVEANVSVMEVSVSVMEVNVSVTL